MLQHEVGIDENNQTASLRVFPNPSNDVVNFIVPKEIKSEYEIKIINNLGQTVFIKKYPYSENNSIDVKEFPEGIYLLKLYTENKTYSGKMQVSASHL